MSLHPLLDLAADPEVRKAAGFRAAAAGLDGESLAARYAQEVSNAPRRHESGRRYLVAYNSRLSAERRKGRDDDHLALALVDHCNRAGELALPDDGGGVTFLHAHVPLKSAAEDKSRGDADPNRGVGKIDLLGIGPEDCLVVGRVRYLAPSSTRGRTGDTPLRAMLEGLSQVAMASANRKELAEELAQRTGRTLSDSPPLLLLVGGTRYWELSRKREAQKGAAWIKEMERLASEIDQDVGVGVIYLGCRLTGDPGWSYPEAVPVLDEPPQLARAWEYGAGRVKPKPRPKAKQVDPADLPVEADLSRPVRSYSISDSYTPGDRIAHPTLGEGIVQRIAGTSKISVLFGDRKSLLVHGRPARSGAPRPAPPGAPSGAE